MRALLRTWMAILVVGCGAGTPAVTPAPSPAATEESTPTAAAPFPIAAFAGISSEPVPDGVAAKLAEVLDDTGSLDAGLSATLMSARGTWSGAKGTADGVRAVTTDTIFSIASTTKAVTAAQVMQLVEARKLGLDDKVADHLPAGLDFDSNGATIRDLLGHRSGIPDYGDVVGAQFEANPLRFWTPAELLAAVPSERTPAGGESEYANVNYLLLGVVIEDVTKRRMVEVLRDGVLGIDGVERLIFQPDEKPTGPIAFDNGQSAEWFESMGGFLPSYALTSDGGAAAMASDSVSLANWWQALCAGKIVSQASLTAMLPTDDWYGLGLGKFRPVGTIGHYGSDEGGVSLAGCMPEHGIVYVVLANRNGAGINADSATPFIEAMRAG